jgi:hypothetical protein
VRSFWTSLIMIACPGRSWVTVRRLPHERSADGTLTKGPWFVRARTAGVGAIAGVNNARVALVVL